MSDRPSFRRTVFGGICTASLVLAVLTFLIWQSRFERLAAPENASFADGSAGWEVTGEGAVIEVSEGRSTTVRLTRLPARPPPVVRQKLHAESQAYVWIRCEYASRDLVPGSADWQSGRVLCYGVDRSGRGMFSHEHQVAAAEGTQTWQKAEVVFELDPRMKQVWICLQNYGNSGEFMVRDFDAAFVRNRPALNWQVPLLVLGWGGWLVALMRFGLGVKTRIWRCALGSTLTLVLFWFLALPGIRTTARPLASGDFFGLQPAAGLAQNSAATARTEDRTRAGDSKVAPLPTTAPIGDLAAPVPRQRPLLEWVSRRWDGLHAVVFFGLSIALLLLTRTGAVWRISAAMALLIQGSEWLEYGHLEWDDLREVLAAAIGIATAMWIWNRMQKRKKESPGTNSVPSS